MRKRAGAIILLIACAVAVYAADDGGNAAPPSVADNSVRQEISELTQQLNKAALHGDASTYDHLLADTYTAVNSQGQVQTKEMIVRATRKHAVKFHSIETRSLLVEVAGDRATATDVAEVKGSYRRRPFAGTYTSKRIWEKRDGQWLLLSQTVFDVK